MRIHILETGEPPAPLKSRFGSYAAMFEQNLSPISSRLSYTASAIYAGDPVPGLSEFDALLITGSPMGVYEGHNWITSAEALVKEAAEAGKPQAGICFGHQLMAQAFGGKVEKSDKGWGVGIHQYNVFQDHDWMTPGTGKIACIVSHQDQVTQLPVGATVFAGSKFCPNGAISYAQGPAISFQMHPEFDHAFAEALMLKRKGRIPRDIIETGLSSLNDRTDRTLITQWIAQFLTNSR